MGLPLASPTLVPDELERRIAELRSVENWLNMNLNVLRMTIQSLEMQKAALAAMNAAAGAAQGMTPAGDHPAAETPEARSQGLRPGREGSKKK
jgi:hypothetical protein